MLPPLRAEDARIRRETFGRFLLALAHLSVVDNHVMLADDAIDSNGAEGERVEANGHTSVTIVSPALGHESINLRAYTRIGWEV